MGQINKNYRKPEIRKLLKLPIQGSNAIYMCANAQENVNFAGSKKFYM
jgi:hypothetical protein